MGSLVSFFVRPGSVVCAGAFLLAYAYRDGPLSSTSSLSEYDILMWAREQHGSVIDGRPDWQKSREPSSQSGPMKKKKQKKRSVNLTRKLEQASVPSRVSRHTASYEPVVGEDSSQSEEEDL